MKMRTFLAINQSLTHGKFEIASVCSFLKCQTVTRRAFCSKLFQEHGCVISAHTTTPAGKKRFNRRPTLAFQ